jgi:hypothetical protein
MRNTVAVPATTLMLAVFPTTAVAAPAQAETFCQFESPSGNIACDMGSLGNKAFASCEITEHAWVAPPRPDRCEGTWGNRFDLHEGTAATLACSSDTLRSNGLPTLSYGSTWPVNPITCDSEPAGMTCTDGGTGHYFQVSRESYQLH